MREPLQFVESTTLGWRSAPRTATDLDTHPEHFAQPATRSRLAAIGGSAWVASFVLHATLLGLTANWFVRATLSGAANGTSRELAFVSAPQPEPEPVMAVGDPTAESKPPEPAPLPPPPPPVAKPQPAVAQPVATRRTAASANSAPTRPGAGGDGAVTTGVFGVAARGFKFVYVFDRSGSMGGTGRSALDAAKSELLASLEQLGERHEFQIVFYNEEPLVLTFSDRGQRLATATAAHKREAARFIARVKPDGATRHEAALRLALALDPDVIFFLTDADQPVLTATQLTAIHRANAHGTILNTIEFGLGPAFSGRNFLADLAEQNGGRHQYVDIARLRR